MHGRSAFWINRFAFCLGIFVGLSPLCGTTEIRAETLVGVVSDNSAAEVLAAAELFLGEHSEQKLQLRTVRQLNLMSDQEIQQLWSKADVLFCAGVFGEQVPRFTKVLDAIQKEDLRFLAMSSDLRLVRRSRSPDGSYFESISDEQYRELTKNHSSMDEQAAHLKKMKATFPSMVPWLTSRSYWSNGGTKNVAHLFAYLLSLKGMSIAVEPPALRDSIRYFQQSRTVSSAELQFSATDRVVLIIDHSRGDRVGDREILVKLEQLLRERNLRTATVLADWGPATAKAIQQARRVIHPARCVGAVVLQDFVLGGGTARAEALEALTELNVPVLKGIRLKEQTAAAWRVADQGLSPQSVYYRVAMPELEGASQPLVLSAAGPRRVHPATGLQYASHEVLPKQARLLADRLRRWSQLRNKSNSEKKVAIVYYNHPPGRHNIGADNLDVVASLWELLHHLQAEGYVVGQLPTNQAALLEQLQARGVNLPNDREQLRKMAPMVTRINQQQYQSWFKELPLPLQAEVEDGSLGFLHQAFLELTKRGDAVPIEKLLGRYQGEIEQILGGIRHPAKERALDLFAQLIGQYTQIRELDPVSQHEKYTSSIQRCETLIVALRETGIEGLRGWGPAPGKSMVVKEQILLPGLQFGNVFIGPQPPRGWEIDEELLHANTVFPPTHQYLAFYFWIRHAFQADAVVHLGRHSTFEFLPRRNVGLSQEDYPLQIAGDTPQIYPYIVDGVGEGIQAKRRGLAVMVDHLTPPLRVTPLYDQLLELRQLVESFESAEASGQTTLEERTAQILKQKIKELHLEEELRQEMAEELKIRGQKFEQINNDLLVHEVGHYLTELQESFMPVGLHVFSKPWSADAVDMMLESMGQPDESLRMKLEFSPTNERDSFLNALEGGFVSPGPGNDPIRSPESLPTGRNFHALDGSVLPTRTAYQLGSELAEQALASRRGGDSGREAIVLWASDVVRDEGVMVAFGMRMMGIEPVWNSRGIVAGVQRIELNPGEKRFDTVFTTSGLFRDLYGNLIEILDDGVLLALQGSEQTIAQTYPKLKQPLAHALKRLESDAEPGTEPLEVNFIAANWVRQMLSELEQSPEQDAQKLADRALRASLRIFGDAPGAYGAGINRLVERSGSWDRRAELAEAYLKRLGHGYGRQMQGIPAEASFQAALADVKNTYHGRSSHLYGLLDNNDGFDYLGGLSLAVEHLSGDVPLNRIAMHAHAGQAEVKPLNQVLSQELRGTFLNPHWIKPLMKHDYAGARTMGSQFIEHLWGWQVTNPEIIKSHVWDDVKAVYLDDRHELGLRQFFNEGPNVHVKANILAVFLVAAYKEFWNADEETLKALAEEFATLVTVHGLPGSGHTSPTHPMHPWISQRLDEELRTEYEKVLADAKLLPSRTEDVLISAVELHAATESVPVVAATSPSNSEVAEAAESDSPAGGSPKNYLLWGLIVMGLLLLGAGVLQGARRRHS